MTTKTILTLVRHGETALNRAGQFRGRADPALTTKGEEQARAVAEALLLKKMPAALYASPRLRAQTTAGHVARWTGLHVETDPRLDDLDYGQWTGITAEEVRAKWSALYEMWIMAPESLEFPDGESMADAASRIETAFSEICQRHAGARVVVVTHDAVIRAFLCRVLSAPLAAMHRFRIDLTSVTVVESIGDACAVTAVNDVSHLGGKSSNP